MKGYEKKFKYLLFKAPKKKVHELDSAFVRLKNFGDFTKVTLASYVLSTFSS